MRICKVFPNIAKITAILIIEDILEPSLCKGAPNGIAMFLICAGMHLSVASRLAGIVAILQVPKGLKQV
jgi:hypothetical protein